MLTRPVRRVLLLPALAIVVLALGACGASGANTASPNPTTPAPPAAATTATTTVLPTPTTPAPSAAATIAITTVPAAAGAPIDFTGYIQQVSSTGDFILDNGQVSYAVVMSPTTAVVNLRGRQVTRLFIVVSGSVQVTGTLTDSKINAQTVLIPTRKDIPDG